MTPDEILAKLHDPKTASERLLDECRSYDVKMWEDNPQLYLEFVERLIQQGHPGRALELAREGAKYLIGDTRLQYQLAWAAARGGNPKYAQTLLDPLLKQVLDPNAALHAQLPTKLLVDIISLQGRIYKDRSQREPKLAADSAEWYERASQIPGTSDLPDSGTFPLINAATMWRIAGDVEKSNALAQDVVRRIEHRAENAAQQGDLWLAATLGEAYKLLGMSKESIEWYRRAIEVANSRANVGELASLRNNLRRLQQAGVTAGTELLDEHLGRVVVFCGHLVDSPDRLDRGGLPRFPNDKNLIAAVGTEIRKRLDELNAKVGYCSLASGGDILFAEAMLDRDAELHIVLPFAQHDFRRTSVSFGQEGREWRNWGMRFDRVLERVEQASPFRIRYATREPYLGSRELFQFANKVLQGLGVLRARERASEPVALVLLDQSSNKPSYPSNFARTWQEAGHACHVIDLAALRSAEHKQDEVPPTAPGPTSTMPRPVKAMLFADVAGYSSIKEWQLPEFLFQYRRYLHDLFVSDVGQKAVYANTWGDGLYVVFSDVAAATDFAMELVEPSVQTQPQWPKFGMGATNPFRAGLHSGPVFELNDIFQGRSCFTGQHVNRAARIEPVTLRGCAYASEPFAASLIMSAGNPYNIETVGVHSLAKEYDRCALYRVSR